MDNNGQSSGWGRPLFHLQCIRNATLHLEHTGTSSVTVILFYSRSLLDQIKRTHTQSHTHVLYTNYACDMKSNWFVLTMVQLSQGIPHNRSMSGVQSDPGLVRLPGVGCISITRMKPIKPNFFWGGSFVLPRRASAGGGSWLCTVAYCIADALLNMVDYGSFIWSNLLTMAAGGQLVTIVFCARQIGRWRRRPRQPWRYFCLFVELFCG